MGASHLKARGRPDNLSQGTAVCQLTFPALNEGARWAEQGNGQGTYLPAYVSPTLDPKVWKAAADTGLS